jgi:hypothetical protein
MKERFATTSATGRIRLPESRREDLQLRVTSSRSGSVRFRRFTARKLLLDDFGHDVCRAAPAGALPLCRVPQLKMNLLFCPAVWKRFR